MSGFIGFNCKVCRRPFFVMHNTARNIVDDASAIKRYEKKGYKLVVIPSELVGDIEKWCQCGEKKGKPREEKSNETDKTEYPDW